MKQYPRDQWEVGKTRASGNVHTPWSGLPPLALSWTKDSQLHSKGLEMTHPLLDECYNLCKDASQPSSFCDLPWDTCLELFRRSQASMGPQVQILTFDWIDIWGQPALWLPWIRTYRHAHIYFVRDTLRTQRVRRDWQFFLNKYNHQLDTLQIIGLKRKH